MVSDHFNRVTIRNLARERPSLRFGTPNYLVSDVIDCGVQKRNIDILEHGQIYIYGNYAICPFPLIHDVSNTGYHISLGKENENIFYATDTNSLDGIEAPGYDLYFVEANYNEKEIVERIRRKQDAGEYCHEWDVLKNHLSREKADDWLYRNMSPKSRYIYLHEHTEPTPKHDKSTILSETMDEEYTETGTTA